MEVQDVNTRWISGSSRECMTLVTPLDRQARQDTLRSTVGNDKLILIRLFTFKVSWLIGIVSRLVDVNKQKGFVKIANSVETATDTGNWVVH